MKKKYLQPEVEVIVACEDIICTSNFDKNETEPMPLFGKENNGLDF